MLCSAGMSTSVLVNKMREAAQAQDYDCDINAYPMNEAEDVAKDADVVLLGPQVRFNVPKIKKVVSCPVEAIDMAAYGMVDGAKVLKRVKTILGDE